MCASGQRLAGLVLNKSILNCVVLTLQPHQELHPRALGHEQHRTGAQFSAPAVTATTLNLGSIAVTSLRASLTNLPQTHVGPVHYCFFNLVSNFFYVPFLHFSRKSNLPL